ncbi:MAG: isoprenylcysteine carboxylmethyltransferase family protein [Nitrososphaerales archaeon]|nr:isoprenylcysteine carboxylmethyltransferase family protein [Nitrososphaerales archaeon]
MSLVVAGFALVVWCFSLHSVQAPRGWQLGEMVPTYLLTSGPYRFTRNPMYLGYGAIWLGWTLFYGSITVLIGLVVFSMLFALFLVPWEEHRLEAQFGDTYTRYRNRVPRWIPRLH